MNDDRPDPDRLLRRLAREDERASRGKLKVFLGAVAGVGKTYAMLEQAHLRRRQGLDVVVGWAETHGRSETDALLQGLERLPPRAIRHRQTELLEFDLDSALARKPTLLLLDELAHTNVPGSRHVKRWQDAEELLAAGIDVYTTVNIQHLESLNDVISQTTGVEVRETIPDRLLDEADEIELIDLTPDDLLERLREGKVYLPAQAEQALRGFFTRGNLIALRELALRQAAARVDAELRTYKHEEEIERVLPVAERLLVCVSPSPSAARVVRSAARMAAGLRAEWIVAYVERPGDPRQTEGDRERIDATMRLAEQLGAETTTLSGLSASDELLAFARSRNVTKIVIGKPARPWWRYRIFGSVVDDLIRHSQDIDVYVIRGEKAGAPAARLPRLRRRSRPPAYAAAVLAVVLTAGVCALLRPHLAASNLAMLFLLNVIFAAAALGRGPSMLASLLSVAAFDFFFVPPYLTFAVRDGQYIVTFGVMLAVALVISTLTVRLRQQAEAHRRRREQTATLYRLTREFSQSNTLAEVARSVERHLGSLFETEVWILLAGPDGSLQPAPGVTSSFPLDAKERSVAEWVHLHGQPAGRGTSTLAGAQARYVPLRTAQRNVGILGLFSAEPPSDPPPDPQELLEVIASQVAVALERALLTDEAQQERLRAETERLRNLLLSSVSHDLRTPLAAITGATSSLLEGEARLSPELRRELTQSILEDAERLNRLLSNLLNMTRLESGPIELRSEWQPIEEPLGAALTQLEKALRSRAVSVDVPPELPLVPIDGILMEQVFLNLLENALKHAGPDAPIEIAAWTEGDALVVEVRDGGPGIPPGDEERIFEKFHRGSASLLPSGAGLGLAICRGILHAHGGTIRAANRPEGGAVFRLSLPLGEPPPPPAPPKEDGDD